MSGTTWTVPGQGDSIGALKRAMGVPAQICDFEIRTSLLLSGDALDERDNLRIVTAIGQVDEGVASGSGAEVPEGVATKHEAPGGTEAPVEDRGVLAGVGVGPAPLSLVARADRRNELLSLLRMLWSAADYEEREIHLLPFLHERLGLGRDADDEAILAKLRDAAEQVAP